jgi:endonuclease/exonuclease/phosphatase family metal-dependent hydrolase
VNRSHASRFPALVALVAAFAFALLPAMASAHSNKGHGNHRGLAPHDKRHGHSNEHQGHHKGSAHHGHHGKGNDHGKRELTVMTRNLYLGSSLGPALEAATPEAFVEGVARIYATVQYTNFPQRAEAIADEIQEKSPDLVGLQEVTKWTTGGLNPPPGYDFLAILENDLAARGLHYTTAAIAHNANIGPAPLALAGQGCVQPGPVITCSVQLEDRDVILVNDDTPGLTWSNPQSGRYATQQAIESPVGPLSFDRGWASIDAKLKNQPFRFVDTHLETEESPLVQEAQATEFLAGPAKGGTIVATGDFNSASDGSTTTSYAQLTAPGKFRDSWNEALLGPGSSCCQESNTPPLAPGALNNPVSTLRTRIDLILSRGAARSDGDDAELVGDTPFQATPPFWPSDHAGVVSVLHLGG